MGYKIRKCTLEDLPDIYINELAYIKEIEPENEQRWMASIPNHLKQWISLLNSTFVLDNGVEILGHVSWMDQDGQALLVSIFVKLQYRRLGLASKLLGCFEDEARGRDHRECILGVMESNPAEEFYLQRGYRFTGKSENYRNYVKRI